MPRPINELVVEAFCYFAAKRQAMLAEQEELGKVLSQQHVDAVYFMIQDLQAKVDANERALHERSVA